MFRLRLGYDDLRKITVGRLPDVMLELALSMWLIQQPAPVTPLRTWHAWSRARLPARVRPVLALTPPSGFVPDFLAPVGRPGDGIDEGMDRLLHTPREQLHAEVTSLAAVAPLPRWARGLADGEPSVLRGLERSLRAYHAAVFAPAEEHFRRQVAHTADRLLDVMAVGGLDAMLNGLHPTLRWRPPYLEGEWQCEGPDVVDSVFDAGGRGLRLQPSFFSHPEFVYGEIGSECILAFPVSDYGNWTPPVAAGDPAHATTDAAARGLAGLLGATRAAVLRTVATSGPQTTTDLARLTGISPATASHHTGALRHAGLLTTRRTGTSVHHAATPLGRQLVLHNT